MSKENPNYNDLGEIFCTDCPHFNPEETPCVYRLDGNWCPTEPVD